MGGGRWREDLVDEARRSIRKGSKSFSFASRLFDKGTRERALLLYAWCRRCDDIADGQDHGGTPEATLDSDPRIKAIRVLTRRALEGEPTADPAFDALGQVAMEAGLDPQTIDDVIAGFALDAAGWQPHSEGDLMRYCYHVAGAVGVMMARVMGVPSDAEALLDRACDLGLAFQLVNIARDLCEDDAVGRCYLPAEWLAEADIPPGEHMKPAYREQLVGLADRLVDLAEQHEAMARLGVSELAFRQRWAVLTAANVYMAIGHKVRAKGPRAWDRRVRTSLIIKLRALSKAWFETLDRAPEPFARPAWDRGRILIAVRMSGPIPANPMTPLPDEESSIRPEDRA
ncbi:MAG: phytoene/squalene synthase family protein [Croceibacterium sp.]